MHFTVSIRPCMAFRICYRKEAVKCLQSDCCKLDGRRIYGIFTGSLCQAGYCRRNYGKKRKVSLLKEKMPEVSLRHLSTFYFILCRRIFPDIPDNVTAYSSREHYPYTASPASRSHIFAPGTSVRPLRAASCSCSHLLHAVFPGIRNPPSRRTSSGSISLSRLPVFPCSRPCEA